VWDRGAQVVARGATRSASQVPDLDAQAVARAEERKGCDSDAAATFAHAVAPVGAPSAAATGLYGEWRGYSKSCCCEKKCRFRKGQVIRRASLARRAMFENWLLAAEQGSQTK
jgi:hypothetical protein